MILLNLFLKPVMEVVKMSTLYSEGMMKLNAFHRVAMKMKFLSGLLYAKKK